MSLLWLWLVDAGFLSVARSPNIYGSIPRTSACYSSYHWLLSKGGAKSRGKMKPILNKRNFTH